MPVKGEEAKGGRKYKERITVLLARSAEGEKLRPFVIGHSANPRCFKGLASLACLPVTYFSNKKAWMTPELFQQWLDKLNSKMKCEGRFIILLVDNCAAHPDIQFSNVQLVFLPPNTTSKLQPCDAGIIQATKMHYRKLLLRHVLFRMNEASCASDLTKSVNDLDAIMWLKTAWDNVKPTTIQKCFAKSGFTQAVFADPEEDTTCTIDSSLGAFMETCGASWEVYADFDQDLATNTYCVMYSIFLMHYSLKWSICPFVWPNHVFTAIVHVTSKSGHYNDDFIIPNLGFCERIHYKCIQAL